MAYMGIEWVYLLYDRVCLPKKQVAFAASLVRCRTAAVLCWHRGTTAARAGELGVEDLNAFQKPFRWLLNWFSSAFQ